MIETVDDIKTIANVGTGTMGHAITLQFALAGYPVHLVGRGEASLEKAMKAIRSDEGRKALVIAYDEMDLLGVGHDG